MHAKQQFRNCIKIFNIYFKSWACHTNFDLKSSKALPDFLDRKPEKYPRDGSTNFQKLAYLDKQMITFSLGRISRIWLVQQVLDTHKNLLHCDSWSPSLYKPP